ncbi:hypothetical protein [Aquiflexum sp.]|uniref:hypothetical protein n=1 Tax=Aquiflexum sp. TaxID=1872584 RepID=UPI00359450FD
MNSIAEIKTTLHQYIAETDDVKILSKLQEYVKNILDKEQTNVTFNSQGKPLTSSQYKKEIDDAVAEVNKGGVVSQEQMEKGFEN